MVQRAPNYPYMFSELPHFPATSYKCARIWEQMHTGLCIGL